MVPYYFTWMGDGVSPAQRAQISAVRRHADQLTVEDVSAMLNEAWRVQVMGAWYAIAQNDPDLAELVHDSFAPCYGTLTAPALTVAVLTYPTPVLRGRPITTATHSEPTRTNS